MQVRQAEVKDKKDWLEMRELLWPDHGDEHQHAIDAYFSGSPLLMDQVFVCEDNHGGLAGFIELQLRNYAQGSRETPVPYIEGWFVHERHRRAPIGRRLLERAEQWALSQGFSQLGSDVEIENQNSINAHLALGFTEVERSVSFLKTLSQDQLTGKTILHTERQQHE